MEMQGRVNGLLVGSLVEIAKMPEGSLNGELGQLLDYSRASDQYEVALINGETPSVDSKYVKTPENVLKPGVGGGPSSFDMLMGPRTPGAFLAEEMADCIFEKGFCVLKTCQKLADLEQTVEVLRELGDEGRLGRLPLEVEEGYLGEDGKGKVLWLDPDDGNTIQNDLLLANDANISNLAGLFQPYSADAIGKMVVERTPALVSLSLQADEEGDYPQPMASDKILGDYLGTWRRGLVRVVHFMGPATAKVTLSAKEGSHSASLPVQVDAVPIDAAPNTIILFRTDCFSFKTEADEEFAMMTASFQSEAPNMVISGYEGDLRALSAGAEGPPPPPGDVISVMAHATRLATSWDSGAMMNTGLQAGCDTICQIPIARFNVDIYWCPDPDELLMRPGSTIQKHTSFVEGIELFDNKHFEISNNEAGGMGPLQRLVLEVGNTLMTKGGIPKKIANRKSTHAGVAVGVDKDDYPTLGIDPGTAMNAYAIIANRFSFTFNMKGPNFVCDTACSASLTAAHCGKLMLYERNYDPLEFLLAIGTHLCLSVGPFIGTSANRMVSPEGRCFTFNASANGYLRGEGTSGFTMKYTSPETDRNAVFRSSCVGQDGRSASLTAPNGPAQQEMIERAIKEARMSAPESTCWECHGTGTTLGDPIEVGAVRKVQVKKPRVEPLMISTMKSNIGHLEGGAAMGGMMKCIEQVMHCQCLSSLHVYQLNAHLDHEAFDAFFETEYSCFKYNQGHAQVTSLGFGGSNGHGVFWGKKSAGYLPSPNEQIMKRIAKMSPAEVRVLGDNPDDWEADLPGADHKPGDTYTIFINSEDPVDVPIRWVKEDKASEEAEEDEEASFSIVGNFNSWEEDRMAPGDVPGQHLTNVTVPAEGVLEFRILKDGDPEKVIGPSVPKCSKKTVPIKGPEKGLTNTWLAKIEADAEVQIELFYLKGKYSILWFKVAQSNE
jgi:polyketide synthase-associated protein